MEHTIQDQTTQKQSLITRIRRRFRDQRGQSTTEYILILAIVVMIASKMKSKLGTTIDGTLSGVDGILQKQVQDLQNSN